VGAADSLVLEVLTVEVDAQPGTELGEVGVEDLAESLLDHRRQPRRLDPRPPEPLERLRQPARDDPLPDRGQDRRLDQHLADRAGPQPLTPLILRPELLIPPQGTLVAQEPADPLELCL